MKYPWQNILYIDALGKTIPYQPPLKTQRGTQHDSLTSSPFINLKQQPDAIKNIPETHIYKPLGPSLVAINAPETGVFSVGCHIEEIIKDSLYQTTAYIEFAVNDQALVGDAGTYFNLYFQFHNRLVQHKFPHAIQFDWVIMPAVFTEVGIQGFTCSIKINTAFYSTSAETKSAWADALSLVTAHLSGVAHSEGNPIY